MTFESLLILPAFAEFWPPTSFVPPLAFVSSRILQFYLNSTSVLSDLHLAREDVPRITLLPTGLSAWLEPLGSAFLDQCSTGGTVASERWSRVRS